MKNLFLLALSLFFTLAYSQEEILTVAEEMPRFGGCEKLVTYDKQLEECSEDKLFEFIYNNLKYPDEAREAGIKGTVTVQFIINEDGSLTDIQGSTEFGEACKAEAERVINKMNENEPTKWRPGYQGGKAVKVLYKVPIRFSKTNKQFRSRFRDSTNELYKVVEQMPRFPGCEDMEGDNKAKGECASEKMLTYIYKNLKYPEKARKAKTQGTVVVQFVVDKDGSIDDAQVVREIGNDCGYEALYLVENMEQWTPGIQRGKAVKVLYTLPIKFELTD